MITSKLSAAKQGTSSLRTTVPEAVVEVLQLAAGDEVEWSIVGGKKAELRKRK